MLFQALFEVKNSCPPHTKSRGRIYPLQRPDRHEVWEWKNKWKCKEEGSGEDRGGVDDTEREAGRGLSQSRI